MAKALDDSIYCTAFLNFVSLDSLRDHLDKNGRPFDVCDPEPLADAQIDRQHAYQTIHAAVDRLPPRQRDVVQAIFFAESTVMHTARQLEVSGAAVVKLRAKALKHLSSALTSQRPTLFA